MCRNAAFRGIDQKPFPIDQSMVWQKEWSDQPVKEPVDFAEEAAISQGGRGKRRATIGVSAELRPMNSRIILILSLAENPLTLSR
jgi:hypothetical protein